MKKTEVIEIYGNDFIAHDATDHYKPLVICYFDDEKVLTYNVLKECYNYVAMRYCKNEENSQYFIIGRKIYKLENFVRTDSHWGLGINTIVEWKNL